jgi:hypothetical protein
VSSIVFVISLPDAVISFSEPVKSTQPIFPDALTSTTSISCSNVVSSENVFCDKVCAKSSTTKTSLFAIAGKFIFCVV